jgi:hypothetical protein
MKTQLGLFGGEESVDTITSQIKKACIEAQRLRLSPDEATKAIPWLCIMRRHEFMEALKTLYKAGASQADFETACRAFQSTFLSDVMNPLFPAMETLVRGSREFRAKHSIKYIEKDERGNCKRTF